MQLYNIMNTQIVKDYNFENRQEFQGFHAHEYYQSFDILGGFSMCEIDKEHRYFSFLRDEFSNIDEVNAG